MCQGIRTECCGEVFQVCVEVCKESIPRVCRGMTPKRYVEFYGEVHRTVCRKKHEM